MAFIPHRYPKVGSKVRIIRDKSTTKGVWEANTVVTLLSYHTGYYDNWWNATDGQNNFVDLFTDEFQLL